MQIVDVQVGIIRPTALDRFRYSFIVFLYSMLLISESLIVLTTVTFDDQDWMTTTRIAFPKVGSCLSYPSLNMLLFSCCNGDMWTTIISSREARKSSIINDPSQAAGHPRLHFDEYIFPSQSSFCGCASWTSP